MAKKSAKSVVRRVLPIACLILALSVSGCSRPSVERISWNVMGTIAAVQTKGCSQAAKEAFAETKAEFENIQTLLNAHCPTSEISRISKFDDSDVLCRCSCQVRDCYEAAFMLKKLTGGAFNPRWRGEGTLDLGAIAKGFAVDKAYDRLSSRKVGDACLVDLGGNIKAVSGRWTVGVKNPCAEGFAATVDLDEGEALATSATYFRGSHIRDGLTGAPVSNGVASVTVLCRSATIADGLSTSLFVLGPEKGRLLVSSLASGSACGEISVFWIMEDGRAFGDARFKQ